MEFLNHFCYLRYLLLNFSDLKPDTRNRLTRSHLRRATFERGATVPPWTKDLIDSPFRHATGRV